MRNPEGHIDFARLSDGRVVIARWFKRQLAHEVVVEWTLSLEGRDISVRDKKTGAPAEVALHRWDEGHEHARDAVRRPDGKWEIEVPIAWHNMCASFSGTFKIELDAERAEALYSDDLHVEI